MRGLILKKVLYIAYNYEHYNKKIIWQLEAFQNFGYETYLLNLKRDNTCTLYNVSKDGNYVIKKQQLRSDYRSNKNSLKSYIEELYKSYHFDVTYFRRLMVDLIGWGKIFQVIKTYKSYIYYEIPTYPLDRPGSLKEKVANSLESIYFKKNIYKFIDCIPTIVQDDCLLDIKMIEYNNSINESFIINDYPRPDFDGAESNFLAIAHVKYWHGYDRFLNSVESYNGDVKINLTIVSSDTSDLEVFKKAAETVRNINNIVFVDNSEVTDIHSYANQFHIALGGLGYFRRGATFDTSIKNKEYCALGLPFVIANYDKSFPTNFRYLYKISSDEELFILEDIITWYKEIFDDDVNYRKVMSEYALCNLTYNTEFKKLLVYSESNLVQH